MLAQKHLDESSPLSAGDKEMARAAQRCIMESLDHSKAASILLKTDTGEEPSVAIPPATLRLIGELLGALSQGSSVSIIPAKREFTTVEAAQFLNVSRPFLIKEIEAGRLRHRMVGTHRRIAFEDLLTYQEHMRKHQEAALDRMAENARELGLDY